MKKYKFKLYISIIILLSITSRLFTAYFFADTKLDNEWGYLFYNLDLTGVLGLNVVIDQFTVLQKFAIPEDQVLPSVFMPPLYAYFIHFINILFNDLFNIVKLVIIFQIFLSLISIYIFFKIARKFEKPNIALTFTFIFSIFPIYIYASTQISSISIQVFLLLCFYYFLLEFQKRNSYTNLIFFSFFSGLLILTRGEFFLFYLFTLIYFFQLIKKDYKALVVSIVITFIVVSPYLKRNYNYFNTIVLTKSFGFNLLKGNNPEFKVEGSDNFVTSQLNKKKIKINNNYEIKRDNYYKKEAIKIIKEDPIKYFQLYLLKIFSFIFIDFNSTYPSYYNILHILPKVILSLTSLAGIFLAIRKKDFFQYLSLYYLITIFLFSVFFILPRYSLILLPLQLLLSMKFLKFIYQRIAGPTH
jgi:4-amino-4-deoxy-L-arabinose transferase-like glycosyltransferase